MVKTVLFWENELNERGTSVAVYDYARYNEELLGNKSIIATTKDTVLTSLPKFQERFNVHLVDKFTDINKIPHDYFYTLKYGNNDGKMSNIAKNCIHAVFPSYEPHGDVYAYISEWLANHCVKGAPYVPHMIDLPNINGDFREFFNIKPNQSVVGYYGGNNFEIEWARKAVINVAKENKDIVFLFMNQDAFCGLDNVKFIKGTYDMNQKVTFINTCDVMIHARYRGETFGLAIGEFSTKNKPIITYFDSPERNHIQTLFHKGFYYRNQNELEEILLSLDVDLRQGDWNCYKEYTPEKVMKKFDKVFLQ